MRNTKKVIAATAAVATLVGLAACGSSNETSAPTRVTLTRPNSCSGAGIPATR